MLQIEEELDSETSQAIEQRTGFLFIEQQQRIFRNGDRIFACLMVVQWLAGIAVAYIISPKTWVGPLSETHLHVWAALFLGGVITLFPVSLALTLPGRAITRHTIAVAQMLTSGLLIHLTGGRIETHFHVFGSLAFLAFYRDWRVLVPATAVIALDHIVRGIYWPQSVYGVLTASPWRWVEHAFWVIFEDTFLLISMRQSLKEMFDLARRQAQLEAGNESVERKVVKRTSELKASQERFRSLSASSPIGIFQTDAEGRCIYTNTRWQDITGLPTGPSLNYSWDRVIHPEDRNMVLEKWSKAMRDGYEFSCESRIQTPQNDVRWIHTRLAKLLSDDGKLAGQVGTVEDITERKLLESRLVQAQKLEAIGQLGAGIAHEINTPIQYIGNNITFLQEAFSNLQSLFKKYNEGLKSIENRVGDREPIREVLAAIEGEDAEYFFEEVPKAIQQSLEGIERVAVIVRAMKEFSQPGSEEMTASDLNHAIETTITVARNEWKYVAEMEMEFDSKLPLVHALPGEFNQVILNLIVNAAHAIAEAIGDSGNGKGVIRVQTRQDGDWAEIRISDTGTGIPPEVRHKIFTHFFTTKKVGKGTGQGLAIAHSVVVKKHGGTITFETEEGKGTTFILRLPTQGPGIRNYEKESSLC